MSVDKKDVEKICRLARLQLSEAETDEAIESFNAVLAMLNELQQIDVSGVDEMAYVHGNGQVMPLRAPTHQAGIAREVLTDNSPQTEDGYILVPKVIE